MLPGKGGGFRAFGRPPSQQEGRSSRPLPSGREADIMRPIAVLAGCAGMVAMLGGAQAQSVTFTLGTTNGPTDSSVLAMERWMEAMALASGGALQMTIIAGGALGGDGALLQQLATNEIQLHVAGPVVVHHLLPEYQCLEAEFVYHDEAHGFRVWTGPLGDEINERLVADHRIRMVGVGSRGARHVTANRPIATPADLQGVKIRVTNPLRESIFAAMGALPGPLSIAELYGALRQGVFDAQENPISTIYGNRFYEVQSHINLTGHVWSYWVVSASEAFLDQLSDEHRAIFMETLRSEGLDWLNEVVPEREKELLAQMQAEGATVVEPDTAAFREVAAPIVQAFAEANCRPGLMDEIATYAE
jgi:TRAP-type transport system periplasmic protein